MNARPGQTPPLGDLTAVGTIRSDLVDPRQAPRQGDEGAPDVGLEVEEWAGEALEGIAVGDWAGSPSADPSKLDD